LFSLILVQVALRPQSAARTQAVAALPGRVNRLYNLDSDCLRSSEAWTNNDFG